MVSSFWGNRGIGGVTPYAQLYKQQPVERSVVPQAAWVLRVNSRRSKTKRLNHQQGAQKHLARAIFVTGSVGAIFFSAFT